MDAIIVGGGIAGLCCAKQLQEAGKQFVIIEASDRVGGRIATDEVEGFLLDRGFQVFLTAYPEAKRVLDYEALNLKAFEPGALIWFDGKLQRLSDPWRRPQHLIATAFSSAASFGDKLKIGSLRSNVQQGSLAELFQRGETSTSESLVRFGFSDRIVDRFFKPFLGGVFLDGDLVTSSRMFEFVFRMFSQGQAVLPAEGMQAIPKQIADQLPADSIRLNTRVTQVSDRSVQLESGESMSANSIVLATANPEASLLADVEQRDACGVTCVYFAANDPPFDEAILLLNGQGKGPINNLCVPNLVAPAYAPAGKSLISATVLGVGHGDGIVDQVRSQLKDWFGSAPAQYQHLRTYEIPFALPSQESLEPVEKLAKLASGVYRCGDDCDTASINGAMASGRRAAEEILGKG